MSQQIGRNDACPCGSGKKFKSCCLGSSPSQPQASLETAVAWHQAGLIDQACPVYERELRSRPQHPQALMLLGAARFHQGRLSEALDLMERSTRAAPDSAIAWGNYSAALAVSGRHDQALPCSLRALRLDPTPQSWQSFCACAQQASFSGDLPEAREPMREALSRPWTRPSLLMRSACSLSAQHPPMARALALLDQGLDLDDQALADLASDALYLTLLSSSPLPDSRLERLSIAARDSLWRRFLAGSSLESFLSLLSALSQQSFLVERLWPPEPVDMSSELQSARDQLLGKLDRAELSSIRAAEVAALSLLFDLQDAPQAALLLDRSWPPALLSLLDQQVRQPSQERQLAARMPALTAIEDAVSLSAQSHYATHPYPRWTLSFAPAHPGGCSGFARELARPWTPSLPSERSVGGWDVLVAGCGTGQHPCELAMQLPSCSILAVDLSAPSLGMAQARAARLGLSSLRFAQADILALGSLGAQFDWIESVGVLHHLRDPLAGLQVLVSLLRPGGLLRLGLYSRRARAGVHRARELLGSPSTPPDLSRIRAARRLVMTSEDPLLRRLAGSTDLLSASNARDLLFPAHEHDFTPIELRDLLDRAGLAFGGFQLPASIATAYDRFNPSDPQRLDLLAWDRFETQHPDSFSGMFQFLAQPISR